jgi:2-methylcitrate dehydratase PrpD
MPSPSPHPLLAALLAHAERLRFDTLTPRTVQAATTFITDSVAVGLAGSRHPRLAQVREAARAWGMAQEPRHAAHEWSSGRAWPAASAALLNAWQIHNQEFDCVHEAAVVHPMATILPTLVAQAERQTAGGDIVSGARLIEALVLAVDTATTIGAAQVAPMRFFRPAMCGALGAALGLAKLAGCGREATADALGIAFSQLAGTMQAHAEGSPMLAMQIGLAARAALTALDLACAGFGGPRGVLDGPFGYFELFDAPLGPIDSPRRAAVQARFDGLGALAQIERLSHKTHPTGRAAQGALDGLATLVHEQGLDRRRIAHIELAAPPLILRLIGRPWRPDMDVNDARLCLPYLAATWLLKGEVSLADFRPEALADAQRGALAARVRIGPNECTDPNALVPQTVTLTLDDGACHRIELPAVLGHPDRPLSHAAQRMKFDRCCEFAGMPDIAAEALHHECQQLAQAPDLRPWLRAMHLPN